MTATKVMDRPPTSAALVLAETYLHSAHLLEEHASDGTVKLRGQFHPIYRLVGCAVERILQHYIASVAPYHLRTGNSPDFSFERLYGACLSHGLSLDQRTRLLAGSLVRTLDDLRDCDLQHVAASFRTPALGCSVAEIGWALLRAVRSALCDTAEGNERDMSPPVPQSANSDFAMLDEAAD